jgi:hypothetical protein
MVSLGMTPEEINTFRKELQERVARDKEKAMVSMVKWLPTLIEWEMDYAMMAPEFNRDTWPQDADGTPAPFNDILPLDSKGDPYFPKPTLDDVKKYRFMTKEFGYPYGNLATQEKYWKAAIIFNSHFLLRALFPMFKFTFKYNAKKRSRVYYYMNNRTIDDVGSRIWGTTSDAKFFTYHAQCPVIEFKETGKASIWWYAMQLLTRNFTHFALDDVIHAVQSLLSYRQEDLAVEFFDVVYKLPEAEQLAIVNKKAAEQILGRSIEHDDFIGFYDEPLPTRLVVKVKKFKDFVTRCQSAPSVGPVNRKRKAEVDVIVIDD